MWAIFSILAALGWAATDIVDKFVLTKWIKNPLLPTIILGVIGLAAGIVVYFVNGFSALSYLNILLALVAGIFYALFVIFYYQAAKIEEISRVVPLFNIAPLFILLLATIFLGEIFTPLKYAGIFFLVIGAVLISVKDFSLFKLSRAIGWALAGVLAVAISAALTKYLLNFADYWTVFAYSRIGATLVTIPIIYMYLPELMSVVRMYGKRVVVIMSASEVINLAGLLLITLATSLGTVSLVSALAAIEPFFVLVFTVFLSLFYPLVLKEEIGRSAIFLKLTAIILMFVGVILIT